MKAIVTIVSQNYISWSLSLFDSYYKFDSDIHFYLFVSDSKKMDFPIEDRIKNLHVYYIKEMELSEMGKLILQKYNNEQSILRWAMKPIVLLNILDKNYDKVIYLDSDIYIYNDPTFLWEELNEKNILLTPHWHKYYDPFYVHTMHQSGICNAGFIGVNINGKSAIEWWAKMCLSSCIEGRGQIYYDQGYLEFLPFLFDKVHILKHLGCNVSNWSANIVNRVNKDNNYYLEYNGIYYPLIFYHFAANCFRQFYNEESEFIGILEPLNNSLTKFGFEGDIYKLGKKQSEALNLNLFQKARHHLGRFFPI